MSSPLKKIFVSNPDTETKLDELTKRYNLSRSDLVRRGVELLHDYLMKNTVPPLSKSER